MRRFFLTPRRLGLFLGLAALSLTAVRVKAPVGYLQPQVPSGLSMIANPLSNGHNTVNEVLTNGVVDGMVLFKLNPANQLFSANMHQNGVWSDPNQTLAPGEGAFLYNPGPAATLTLVGSFPVGSSTNALQFGLSLVSSMFPASGQLDTALNFPVGNGDVIYRFNNASGTYKVYTYDFGSWTVAPSVNICESFFVWKAAATNWVQTYTF